MTRGSRSRSARTSESTGDTGITRRRALGDAVLCLGALAAPALAGCTVPVRSLRLAPGEPLSVALESCAELRRPGGRVQIVSPSHGTWFVTRRESGELLAVSATCTHQACDVASVRGEFRCPCHGSRFDATGRVLSGPARRDLRRAVAREVDGRVRIDLAAPVAEEVSS